MSEETGLDALWSPLVNHGASWCAPNISADAHWIESGEVPWRVAVTRPVRRNCYVVSATGQYLDYAHDEIRRLPAILHRTLSRVSLHAVAPMLRRLDPIVILDALPVSTVLHPHRSAAQWSSAVQATRRVYPSLPIVVRSLDDVVSGSSLVALRLTGLEIVPSRLVFHQDPRHAEFWRIRNVRNDMALADEVPLESRPLCISDVPRVAELYWQLYGQKHSQLNPQFSGEWLAHGMTKGVLSGEAIVHDGRLAAAYLSYSVGDVMTNPVFGYDTTLPQQLGLYRRLSLLTMRAARVRELRIHASSGAPGFKASRGGVACMEYHAVDLRGVRGAQRAAWALLIRASNALAPSLLRSAR